MFGSLGISSAVSFIHMFILIFTAEKDNDNIPFNIVFIGILLMAFFYLFGLVIYVNKWPE